MMNSKLSKYKSWNDKSTIFQIYSTLDESYLVYSISINKIKSTKLK